MTKYNITMIGDNQVGKTSIANSLLKKPFSEFYVATVGAAMVRIQETNPQDNSVIMYYLWDTAGTEKYKSLAPVYFRESNAAVIVYDLTNEDSFEHIIKWYEFYFQNIQCSESNPNPVMIIANKTDKLEENGQKSLQKGESSENCDRSRCACEEKGRKWAEANKCRFLSVSAKTGENIEKILPVLKDMLKDSKPVMIKRIEKADNDSQNYCC